MTPAPDENDEEVVRRGRRLARQWDTSISRLVEKSLRSLTEERDESTPLVAELRDSLPGRRVMGRGAPRPDSAPDEEPEDPEVVVPTHELEPAECVDRITAYLRNEGYIERAKKAAGAGV